MPQRNCVKVAQQTLTLYVGVRIPIPLPKQKGRKSVLFALVAEYYLHDENPGKTEGLSLAPRREKETMRKKDAVVPGSNPYSAANKKVSFVYRQKGLF